jgi:hypothetical protein
MKASPTRKKPKLIASRVMAFIERVRDRGLPAISPSEGNYVIRNFNFEYEGNTNYQTSEYYFGLNRAPDSQTRAHKRLALIVPGHATNGNFRPIVSLAEQYRQKDIETVIFNLPDNISYSVDGINKWGGEQQASALSQRVNSELADDVQEIIIHCESMGCSALLQALPQIKSRQGTIFRIALNSPAVNPAEIITNTAFRQSRLVGGKLAATFTSWAITLLRKEVAKVTPEKMADNLQKFAQLNDVRLHFIASQGDEAIPMAGIERFLAASSVWREKSATYTKIIPEAEPGGREHVCGVVFYYSQKKPVPAGKLSTEDYIRFSSDRGAIVDYIDALLEL